MEESCVPESLSSCRSVSDVSYYVRNKVELCIQNYMNLEKTAKYLEKNHQIRKTATHLVWEQLRKENPDFFVHFDLRCKMVLQMRMYNDILTKQAVQMLENGLLDISDASPSVKTLLRQQHSERVHLLETLAFKKNLSSARTASRYAKGQSAAQSQNPCDQQYQMLNPASLALSNANGSSVAQCQNPYDQQYQGLNPESLAFSNANGSSAAQWQMPNEQLNQQLPYASSLPLPATNVISVTQLPIPYDQQEQPLYTTSSLPLPTPNGPSMMQMPIPYDQHDQHLYNTSSLPLPTANGPSMTPLLDPYNQQDQPHQYNDPIDNFLGAPTFAPLDSDAFADLSKFGVGGDNGHNGPSSQDLADTLMHFDEEQQQDLIGQQYEPNWQQQNFQVEGSIDELLSDIFDITFTNVHQQQVGGVEAAPLVAMQPDEQMQQNVQVVAEAQQTMQSKKICTSVDQKQAGGVQQRHYPESEALNNPNSGYTGHNGPGETYINSAAQLVTQPNEQLQRQNVPVETLTRGGSNDNEFCNDFEQKQTKRMCTSVDQQQAGRVKRQCHESEALTNPNTGTQATGVNQQRSPKTRYESKQ